MLATLLAALPVGPLVACYLWLDRYEPEPRSLLVAGLLWGAFVATAARPGPPGRRRRVGGVSETRQPGGRRPGHRGGDQGRLPPPAAVVAPRTSSTASSTASSTPAWSASASPSPRTSSTSPRRTTAPTASAPAAPTALTATFVVRCLFSPFAHPLLHRVHRHRGRPRGRARAGPAVRVLAPAGRATLAPSLRTPSGTPRRSPASRRFVVVYVVLMVPAFVGVVAFAVWSPPLRARHARRGPHDAADRGLIPATDIPWLVDLPRPSAARACARSGPVGRTGERAMRDYQQAAIELGFLHHRYLRGTAPTDFAVRGQEYVEADRRRPPVHRLPRTGGAHPMTDDATTATARPGARRAPRRC